ncbi:hypothetical protein [endosymbiont GvMRE of Glomus versiforme]|uniref:hypothetical protein n=1 Tax=endosymbiont GvMRE of Glomus versiforme TaxID=2039283 RepID=UPI0011C3C0C3|nr:hypothetical protein [endosymbiont GvMRE of Glomus versiforme]
MSYVYHNVLSQQEKSEVDRIVNNWKRKLSRKTKTENSEQEDEIVEIININPDLNLKIKKLEETLDLWKEEIRLKNIELDNLRKELDSKEKALRVYEMNANDEETVITARKEKEDAEKRAHEAEEKKNEYLDWIVKNVGRIENENKNKSGKGKDWKKETEDILKKLKEDSEELGNIEKTIKDTNELIEKEIINAEETIDEIPDETAIAKNARLTKQLISKSSRDKEAKGKLKEFIEIPDLKEYNDSSEDNQAWQKRVDEWIELRKILKIGRANISGESGMLKAAKRNEESLSLLIRRKTVDFPRAMQITYNALKDAKGTNITDENLTTEINRLYPKTIKSGETWINYLHDDNNVANAANLAQRTTIIYEAISSLKGKEKLTQITELKKIFENGLGELEFDYTNKKIQDLVNANNKFLIWMNELGIKLDFNEEKRKNINQLKNNLEKTSDSIKKEINTAKNNAQTRLTTLKGGINDNALKTKINDTDHNTIATGDSWTEHFNRLTTAQELDAYTGKVEAAIRALTLTAARTATKNRIEAARSVATAINHNDLKRKINDDGETIADPGDNTADSWHAWIDNANAAELAEREGKALKAIAAIRNDLTTAITTEQHNIETAQDLTNLDPNQQVSDADLKDWLNNPPQNAGIADGDDWKNWLQTSANVEELTNRVGLIYQGIGIIRQKQAVVWVIEELCNNQNVNHNNLYDQLRDEGHITDEPTWQVYIINSTPADLAERKLNTLNSLAKLIIAKHSTTTTTTDQSQLSQIQQELTKEKKAHD